MIANDAVVACGEILEDISKRGVCGGAPAVASKRDAAWLGEVRRWGSGLKAE